MIKDGIYLLQQISYRVSVMPDYTMLEPREDDTLGNEQFLILQNRMFEHPMERPRNSCTENNVRQISMIMRASRRQALQMGDRSD